MFRGALEPWHLLILVIVLVVLFGWKKLPDISRSFGRSARILKSEVDEMKAEKRGQPSAAAGQTVPGSVSDNVRQTTSSFREGFHQDEPAPSAHAQGAPVQPGYAQPQPVQPQSGYAQPQPVQPQPAQPQPGYAQPQPAFQDGQPQPGYPQPGYPQGQPQPGYPQQAPYPQGQPQPVYPQSQPATPQQTPHPQGGSSPYTGAPEQQPQAGHPGGFPRRDEQR